MHHVFISYARADSHWVLAVVDHLRNRGVGVWVDQRDIPCSVPWFREIQVAIRAAALVVVFESLNWFESPNCTAELREAQALSVPLLHLEVQGDSPDSAAERIVAALRTRGQVDALRTEMLAVSHDWRDAGEPRSHLTGGARLRQMSRAADGWEGKPEVVDYYLAASTKSRTRKQLMALLSALVAIVAVLASLGALAITRIASRQIAETVGGWTAQSVVFDQVDRLSSGDPFAGAEFALKAAQEFDEPDSVYVRQALVVALSDNTPSRVRRAGSIPDDARAVARTVAASPDGHYVAKLEKSGMTLVIRERRSGVLRRLIALPSAANSVAFSSDDRRVAVATGRVVRVYGVESGLELERYVGAPEAIVGVAWDGAQGTIRTDLDDGREILWETSRVRATRIHPDRWYMGAVTLPGSGSVAALSRNGTVDLLDPRDGRIVKSWSVGAPSSGIAANQSQIAVTPTGEGVSLIDVSADSIRTLDTAGCSPLDVAFTPTGDELLLACSGEGVGRLTIESGEMSLLSGPGFEQVVSVAAVGNNVIAGMYSGLLSQMAQDGSTLIAPRGQACLNSVKHLAVTAGEDAGDRGLGYVFNAGPGTPYPCGSQYALFEDELKPGGWPSLRVGSQEGYTSSEAVAVSLDPPVILSGWSAR